MTTSVFCTFRVAGFHHWPTAPDKYAYLRHAHRHVFYVRVDAKVEDKDRAIEFIEFKHHAERRFGFLSNEGVSGRLMICDFGTRSCEQLASELLKQLLKDGYDVTRVEVSEDGENGGIIER